MNKDKRLQAEEKIMEAVCDLCRWPYVYRAAGVDEETMYAEKCENCPAGAAVRSALTEISAAFVPDHNSTQGGTIP